MSKCIIVAHLFDDDERAKVREIMRWGHGKRMMDDIVREVVMPCIDRINFITGQDNLPLFVAYQLIQREENRLCRGGLNDA